MNNKSSDITRIVEKGSLTNNKSNLYLFTKRIFDITISMIGIIFFSPILIMILAALIFRSREPVFIAYEKLGFKGRVFKIYSFYSNDSTRLGRILIKTKLKKLPTIFNVLRGHMCIVGTKSGNIENIHKYNDWHALVMSAKPGITGLWRINPVDGTDFEEISRVDMKYVRERGFRLDMYIMLRSISVLIAGKRRSLR